MLLDTVNVCVVRVRNYTTASFFALFLTLPVLKTTRFLGNFKANNGYFLANFWMKTGLMTHREGFCTGTAKSVSRYNIYLELIAVYRYIVAPLQARHLIFWP